MIPTAAAKEYPITNIFTPQATRIHAQSLLNDLSLDSLHLLIESMNAIVIGVDSNGMVNTWNCKAVTDVSYTKEKTVSLSSRNSSLPNTGVGGETVVRSEIAIYCPPSYQNDAKSLLGLTLNIQVPTRTLLLKLFCKRINWTQNRSSRFLEDPEKTKNVQKGQKWRSEEKKSKK
jgi:hypothetical protein